MKTIIGIHDKIGSDIRNGELLGQINQAIAETDTPEKNMKLKRIEEGMGHL